MLGGYEDRQLSDNEFRILQGVLSSDFHTLELMKYIEEEQKKEADGTGTESNSTKTPAKNHLASRFKSMFMNLPQMKQV